MIRTEVRIDSIIPPPRPGWAGRLERFRGPGKTWAECGVGHHAD